MKNLEWKQMMKLTKKDYYPLATVRKLREAELFLKQTKECMASDPFFF